MGTAIIYHPREEGLNHINVYSKSQTSLGRALSNFFFSPFIHPVYGKFNTMEGFYCYLLTGNLNEDLRDMKGAEAKAWGKHAIAIRKIDAKFKKEIQEGIAHKIIQNVYIQKLLLASGNLMIRHYYFYGDPTTDNIRVYDKSKEHSYMLHAIEEIRKNLRDNGLIITSYNKSKLDSDGRSLQYSNPTLQRAEKHGQDYYRRRENQKELPKSNDERSPDDFFGHSSPSME